MEHDAPNPLPADISLGPVRIAVGDVGRSVAWYDEVMGLRVHDRGDGGAVLGDGSVDLVLLDLEPAAATPPDGSGMHHFALNLDTRDELGRVIERTIATQTPIDRAADHGTHEAIYITDPDGHCVEVAWDRPRSEWQDMRTAGYTPQSDPFDIDALVATLADRPAASHLAEGIWVGHVHLIVGDIQKGLTFYRDVVGFDLMTSFDPAMFLSAGGYHHHMAVNGMRGPVGPLSKETVGLREWTMQLSDDGAAALKERVQAAGTTLEDREDGFTILDPWSIPLTVRSSN